MSHSRVRSNLVLVCECPSGQDLLPVQLSQNSFRVPREQVSKEWFCRGGFPKTVAVLSSQQLDLRLVGWYISCDIHKHVYSVGTFSKCYMLR